MTELNENIEELNVRLNNLENHLSVIETLSCQVHENYNKLIDLDEKVSDNLKRLNHMILEVKGLVACVSATRKSHNILESLAKESE